MMMKRVLRFAFTSLEKALFDPSKHSNMDKKNMPFLYESLWAIGKYPDYYFNNSIASRAYEPEIITHMVSVLAQNYSCKIAPQLIIEKGYRKISRFLLKDAKVDVNESDFLSVVLRRLAKSIIVKESRFTWPIEQRIRLQASLSMCEEYTPQSITQFFEAYNTLIENLVLFSTLGYSPFINQEGSALQRLYESKELKSKFTIPEQNMTPINKLLVQLHR